MFFRRWWLLPALGILGALTKPKQSVVPFSICMAGTWWLFSARGRPNLLGTAFWVGCPIRQRNGAGYGSSIVYLIWPWSFALSRDAHSNYAWNFVAWFADRGSFQRRRAATGSSRPQLCCAKSAAEKLEQLAQRERSLPVPLRGWDRDVIALERSRKRIALMITSRSVSRA